MSPSKWATLHLASPSSLLTLAVVAPLLTLLSSLGSQLYSLRSIDRGVTLTRYANYSSINSQHCLVHHEANACEDIRIHYPSSTAFLACGIPEERTHWYPPSCRHDAAARREDSFIEDLFKYDIKTKLTTKLRIDGLEGDFINHGIDVYSFPNDTSKIHIFAVNHGRGGDTIVIFSHILGSDSVQVVKEARHPGIKTANGVAANGPFDFFITNDHFFKGGVFRTIEDTYGPWPWATDVQYCDANGRVTQCTRSSRRAPGFNGIALSEDQKTLFVGDSKFGVVTVFDVLEDRSLVQTQTIPLGAAADNIRILPTTGDPIIAVFPELEDLPHYLANVHALGRSVLVPSGALRLRRDRNYEPELIFRNDGSSLSFMTVATIDPYNRVFIGGAVLQFGGFAVCDLPDNALDW